MDETTKGRKVSHRLAGAILAAMLLLPVLYVLSTGPVSWLALHGHMSEPTLEALQTFYAPIGWIEPDSTAGKAVQWYMDLWVG